MHSKRSRAASQTSSESPSLSSEPTPKAARTALPSNASNSPLLCTLPPTCNPPHNHPTPLANTGELEAHYATFHAHVCEERGCGCVFPDARLLELHQTECHDPLAAVRKDRGEKIFACHIVTCPRQFLTPKARRLHLIQAHGYPKEFFFSVTNKGVGGLLKRWGEGASMVRGQWKSREQMDVVDDTSESEDGNGEDEESEKGDVAIDVAAPTHEVNSAIGHAGEPNEPMSDRKRTTEEEQGADESVVTLAGALDALSLVPPKIKFGRGAKRGAYGHHGRGREYTAVQDAGPAERGALRGRGYGRGAPAARGRGALAAPSSTVSNVSSNMSTRAMNDPRTQTTTRGILGAGNLRGGTRGFPRVQTGVVRESIYAPIGMGRRRAPPLGATRESGTAGRGCS